MRAGIRPRHRPDAAKPVEQDLIDRQDFERKLDEMVDSIHRYDLGGLGAAALVDQRTFR